MKSKVSAAIILRCGYDGELGTGHRFGPNSMMRLTGVGDIDICIIMMVIVKANPMFDDGDDHWQQEYCISDSRVEQLINYNKNTFLHKYP